MEGTKLLMVRINGCRDCPYITVKGVADGVHPFCGKTGTDLYTGCKAIPIPQNCPLPDPVWATVAMKDFK